MKFTVVIPARYASTRLPAKPLADIQGRPMVLHVVERAYQSGANRVIVATDDQSIVEALQISPVEVMMTSKTHQSGTERLAEVVQRLALQDDEIIVNVQGDEPLIPPVVIHQVAEILANQQQAPMATLSAPITQLEDLKNPNLVKVVTDAQGYALYFSRAGIPFQRDSKKLKALAKLWQRHIGIYAYRAGFITKYAAWQASPIEQCEQLEQLRVLWHQEKIKVAEAIEVPPPGVDTEADLESVRAFFLK